MRKVNMPHAETHRPHSTERVALFRRMRAICQRLPVHLCSTHPQLGPAGRAAVSTVFIVGYLAVAALCGYGIREAIGALVGSVLPLVDFVLRVLFAKRTRGSAPPPESSADLADHVSPDPPSRC